MEEWVLSIVVYKNGYSEFKAKTADGKLEMNSNFDELIAKVTGRFGK